MKSNNPPQAVLKSYLATRRASGLPPPSMEEIRRQLGWFLRPGNNKITTR